MRVSVPGVPGVYYDTDTKSTALTTAFSVVGRRVPRPQRYALQALPLLWSLDVDLQEVPNDHPFQYIHPEGAHSIEELTQDREMPGPNLGREFERTLQFAMAVNRETERGIDEIIGRGDDVDEEGTVIEIREVDDDGEPIDESDVVSDGPDLDDGSDLLDDISDGDDGGADGVEDGLDGVDVDPDADQNGPDDGSDRDEFGHDDESDLANGR